MEKISNEYEHNDGVHDFVNAIEETKTKAGVLLRSVMGVLLTIGILIAEALFHMVDADIESAWDLGKIGLKYFILLFCSYGIFCVNYKSGTRQGLLSSEYKAQCKSYAEVRERIIKMGKIGKIADFCVWWSKKELRNAREEELVYSGISYEEYEKKYLGKDKKDYKNQLDSKIKVRSVAKANKMRAVKLYPETILQMDSKRRRRGAVGMSSRTKRGFNYATKLITTGVNSAFFTILVLESFSIDFTFAGIALTLLKLMFSAYCGFTGYMQGYENIEIVTVNYIGKQENLMLDFEKYCEAEDGV